MEMCLYAGEVYWDKKKEKGKEFKGAAINGRSHDPCPKKVTEGETA